MRRGGISAWLYRLESVAALGIRFQSFEAIEVGVEGRRIVIGWVGIAAETVRLPNFKLSAAQGIAIHIQHATHHVQNLPRRSFSPPWQMRQVATVIGGFPPWIEGSQYLFGGASQRLRKRCLKRRARAKG